MGSCSAKGNLNFNLKLAALPEDLIEYIVIHELIHLIERNHNKIFWREVSKYCSDYREKEKELPKYWFAIGSNKVWNKILRMS